MRKFSPMPLWTPFLTDGRWTIHANDGSVVAAVTVSGRAQRHALLLADAPSLFNELVIADELLSAALNLMTLEQKTALAEKAAAIHCGEGAIRAAERERLLMKHAGGQRDGRAALTLGSAMGLNLQQGKLATGNDEAAQSEDRCAGFDRQHRLSDLMTWEAADHDE